MHLFIPFTLELLLPADSSSVFTFTSYSVGHGRVLCYNAIRKCAESQSRFRKNMLHSSSGLKSKLGFTCWLLLVGFLLCILFDPEEGGDMFLRNDGTLSTEYIALYPRRYNSSSIFMFIIRVIYIVKSCEQIPGQLIWIVTRICVCIYKM
jgi:hypothetical protein